MQKKKCTRCDEEYEIEKFEKGAKGKYTSRCKICANAYVRDRKEKKKEEKEASLKKELKIERSPVFEDRSPTDLKVQRVQLLTGDTDTFVEILCPCGNSMKLQYRHSFDSKNDYYEEECLNCNKLFKMTITTIEKK